MKDDACFKVGCNLVSQLKIAMTRIDEIEKIINDNPPTPLGPLENPKQKEELVGGLNLAHTALREQIRLTIQTIQLLIKEKPFSTQDFPEFHETLNEFKRTHGWFGWI